MTFGDILGIHSMNNTNIIRQKYTYGEIPYSRELSGTFLFFDKKNQ